MKEKIIRQNVNMTCSIFEKLFDELKKNRKKFVYETDIKKFMEKLAKENKCDLSYPTIVATNKNSAVPHHSPKKEKLKGFTVLDFGVKKNGYCSDISRTIYFGKPSKKEISDYNKVLNSQKKYIKMLKIGISLSELNLLARKDLGKHFIHSLGHGFGIEVHEEPFFRNDNILKKNDFITIEPGLYFENKYGIRIEDDIFVGDKIEVLSKSLKKDLLIY